MSPLKVFSVLVSFLPRRHKSSGKLKITFLFVISGFVLSSCEPDFSHIKGEFNEGDRGYPPPNSHPTRFVQLTGTISPSLQVELLSVYQAQNTDKKCRYTVNSFEGVSSQLRASFPLGIKREKDKISTTVPLDYFAPGFCNYRFYLIRAVITKGTQQSQYHILATSDRYVGVDKRVERPRENWATNSAPTPVIVRCRFPDIHSGKSVHDPCNFAKEKFDQHEKFEHLITPDTDRIDLVFMDMNISEN